MSKVEVVYKFFMFSVWGPDILTCGGELGRYYITPTFIMAGDGVGGVQPGVRWSICLDSPHKGPVMQSPHVFFDASLTMEQIA